MKSEKEHIELIDVFIRIFKHGIALMEELKKKWKLRNVT